MKKGARETGIDHLGAMRAFVRVVETGSFSAVAKEMHVSTSTVARKVTAIEEALGVALLHRSTHSVTLTEAGHIYLERAVTLIADLDDTLRVVAELNAQPSGPLKLTAPVAFGRRHLAPELMHVVVADDRDQDRPEHGYRENAGQPATTHGSR